MPQEINNPFGPRPLPPRPMAEIEEQQKRHDRARNRALTGIFCSLLAGCGLGVLIDFSPMLLASPMLQAVLIVFLFVLPFFASLIAFARAPAAPMEMQEERFAGERKQAQWRVVLLSQVLMWGTMGIQWVWLRPPRVQSWPIVLASLLPVLMSAALGVMTLCVRPGWLNPELRKLMGHEVTQSFRARAQKLGYALLLFILCGFCVLARLNPQVAARFLPLGLTAGVTLPVLYFVFLDWQASRSG